MAITDPPISIEDHLNFIVEEPLLYEQKKYFDQLIQLDLQFIDLRNTLKRIYNLNESSLLEASDATKGVMGLLNRRDTKKRIKRFNRKIDNGFRDQSLPSGKSNKIILAEGDSWFNFPVFIKDIIDHLAARPDFAVYSIAYGGDWITNIIYEEKYVEELSTLSPDIFLISGSGNDMVAANKPALMVDKECNRKPKFPSPQDVKGYWDTNTPKSWTHYQQDKQEIYDGHLHLTNRFYSFILVMKANYYLILRNLNKAPDFRNKMVITQGYDYPVPCLDNHFSLRYPLEYVINWFLDTGKWLARPMSIKGITEPGRQRKIVKAMIFFLNEMFIELSTAGYFNNIRCVHLDNRYIADRPSDWYDELHLKNYKFGEIASAYTKLIHGEIPESKVVAIMSERVFLNILSYLLKINELSLIFVTILLVFVTGSIFYVTFFCIFVTNAQENSYRN